MLSSRYQAQSTVLGDGHVMVTWADGHVSSFLFMWLRDNCSCAKCGAHGKGSRFQGLLDIPDDIAPERCAWDEASLTIHWSNDGHVTRLPAKWLRDYCNTTSERGRRSRRGKATIWDGRLAELPAIDYKLSLRDPCELKRAFSAVVEYGFALIRDLGTECGEIERLAQMLGYVRETHYGRVYDLRIRENPTIIGETSAAVLPHSDETYRHVPTGINMFHCIQPSTQGGGDTMLVDGYNVAAQLKAAAPELFSLLCQVPVQHERRIDGQTIRSQNPVFTIDFEGDVVEVRLNERTTTGIAVPKEVMAQTYQALRETLRIAYDRANRVEYRMEAGDALIMDNLRVLHGRTQVAGERFLQQSQVMRDEFYARWAALDEGEG